jgi:hypothetical protein
MVALLSSEAMRGNDDALADFVDQADADFYHCRITCSLAGGENVRIERVTLRFSLEGEGDADDKPTPAAIWSMAPLQLVKRSPQPLGVSVGVNFGPFLKLAGTWAEDMDRERCYVFALGEGESKAEWRYTRQPDVPLDGPHRMDAVIRLPRQGSNQARLALTGTGRRRKLGLFPFRARLERQQRELSIGP